MLHCLARSLLLADWRWLCGCLGLQLSHLCGQKGQPLPGKSASCLVLPRLSIRPCWLYLPLQPMAGRTLGSDTLLRFILFQTHFTEYETLEAQGSDLQRSQSVCEPRQDVRTLGLHRCPRRLGSLGERGPLTRCRSRSASARWASSCCLHWVAAALASRRAPANLLLLSCSAKNSASHCTSPTELRGSGSRHGAEPAEPTLG